MPLDRFFAGSGTDLADLPAIMGGDTSLIGKLNRPVTMAAPRANPVEDRASALVTAAETRAMGRDPASIMTGDSLEQRTAALRKQALGG